ncbi:MAG: FixH family protein [Bacillus sp. (in: firmicutes)]
MMKKMGVLLVFCVLLLMACGKEEQTDDQAEVAFLEVDLSISPEKAKVNEPVTFKAKVTYGGKPVEDADEVKFEIWRSQSEDHEKIEIKHAKEGIYALEKTFKEEGTYYIYAHVTAEAMHSMPKKEFTIGRPSEPEE